MQSTIERGVSMTHSVGISTDFGMSIARLGAFWLSRSDGVGSSS